MNKTFILPLVVLSLIVGTPTLAATTTTLPIISATSTKPVLTKAEIAKAKQQEAKKKAAEKAAALKKQRELAQKRAAIEATFRKVTKSGLEYVIAGFSHDFLLARDQGDYVKVAKNFNIFSAMIHVAKSSQNRTTARLANDMEDRMVQYQKYYFPLIRKQYLALMNEGRDLNNDFKYPNRCFAGDTVCDSFEIDSYCTAGKTQDEQLNGELSYREDDLIEMHIQSVRVLFKDMNWNPDTTARCDDFNKMKSYDQAELDSFLVSRSYLGL